eukprot:gene34257-56997_t
MCCASGVCTNPGGPASIVAHGWPSSSSVPSSKLTVLVGHVIAQHHRTHGRHALAHTHARLQGLLKDSLLGVIDDVRPNPDVAHLSALYDRFWQSAEACDAIVAVGGGSAIDTAKALMVGTAGGRFDELVGLLAAGKPFVPTRVKPLIAVPTTAGTGSEVTPWATIWDADNQKKHSLHLDATWPEVATIDPELMLSVPAATTVSPGLDA